MVKERRENGRFIFKDLKQYMRKPERLLKHKRMIGSGW